MKNIISATFIILLFGACGKEPLQEACVIDKDLTVELSVKMESNDKIEDSHTAIFSISKGSSIPSVLTLKSDPNVVLTFTNFRLKDNKATFDAWSFDGFNHLSSHSGTKGKAWPYEAALLEGFSIPIDGSKKLNELLTWFDKTAINNELIKAFVTLNIKQTEKQEVSQFPKGILRITSKTDIKSSVFCDLKENYHGSAGWQEFGHADNEVLCSVEWRYMNKDDSIDIKIREENVTVLETVVKSGNFFSPLHETDKYKVEYAKNPANSLQTAAISK